jgi:hypothetical protein
MAEPTLEIVERLTRIETVQGAAAASIEAMERSLRELVQHHARETEQVYRLVDVQLKALGAQHDKDMAESATDRARIWTRLEEVANWRNRMSGGLVVINIAFGLVAGGVVAIVVKLLT